MRMKEQGTVEAVLEVLEVEVDAAAKVVAVEAVVLGDSIIHHIVEGDTVLTYRQPEIGGWELETETGWVEDKSWVTQAKGTKLTEGYIALQGESHPVHFRKIELLDLSDEYDLP